MKRAVIAVGVFVALLLVFVLAAHRAREQAVFSPSTTPTGDTAPAVIDPPHPAFIHGRVTTRDGAVYEGRLRWGDGQETFWSDWFDGRKIGNTWAELVPPEQLLGERRPVRLLGMTLVERTRAINLDRPFLARFGDIARVESLGAVVRLTLKSGTVIDLDRHEASDFDDGVRVWDKASGMTDLGPRQINTIEFFPPPGPGVPPARLHGSVSTARGEFTGFIRWDREACVGADELGGTTGDAELSLHFDDIRSIVRVSMDSALVTLLDGREVLLSGASPVGQGHRGIHVDHRRYGRVLVSWGAFERVLFSRGGSGPAYGDFPPGRPLTGAVTTRSGRRLAGRLVYDLDESETTETLDAPSRGVDYAIPFGLVASIIPAGRDDRGAGQARVILHGGEELKLECAGDLGEGNAGMLVFTDGEGKPAYVPWADAERIEFNRPPAMYPPFGGAASDGESRGPWPAVTSLRRRPHPRRRRSSRARR